MSPNLREQKRLATLAAIEDSATSLVVEHGYEAVTVDDICLKAEISRRTFFNYVDSKETAVIGQPPREISEAELTKFATTHHADLFAAVLELCFLALPESSLPAGQASELVARRKAIKQANPGLAYTRLQTFSTAHAQVHRAVEQYFSHFPDAQKLNIDANFEAELVVSVAAQSLQLGYLRWMSAGLECATLRAFSDEVLTQLKQLFTQQEAHG
ncbi:helix-turn-helix domain-containing protein [Staphylococcus chromogenes]|nr:helix-turn-helix domain-containing protein [Staphylococcus chromogenes]